MVVPIKIDFSDFVQEWNLQANEAQLFASAVLDEIAVRFADQWKAKAGQLLKQTKQEYQRGIYIEKPDENSVIVGLAGWLPNAIERGLEAFDMKEGFQGSSKRKMKKGGGWFLTIPLRHGTPGIVGESEMFSTIMPAEVHKVALQQLRGEKKSIHLIDLPPEFQVKKARELVANSQQVFQKYEHKSAIYEGLTRSQKAGHSHYMTFRRVSDLSDPNAWIHSGIKAYDLLGKTLGEFPIADIISDMKEDFLQNR